MCADLVAPASSSKQISVSPPVDDVGAAEAEHAVTAGT